MEGLNQNLKVTLAGIFIQMNKIYMHIYVYTRVLNLNLINVMFKNISDWIIFINDLWPDPQDQLRLCNQYFTEISFFIHQDKTEEHDTKCKEFEELSTRCDGEMKELNEQINALHQVCHYQQFFQFM